MSVSRHTRSLIVAASLLATVAAGLSVCRVYLVSSGSMSPTLVPGDIILCVKTPVRRGSVVVFRSPLDEDYTIKRVVAVPRDAVSYEKKSLSVNGEPIEKVLIKELTVHDAMDLMFEQSIGGKKFGVFEAFGESLTAVVRETTRGYFVMGDSRDASVDSRHFGTVPEDRIECVATAILITEQLSGAFSLVRTGRL